MRGTRCVCVYARASIPEVFMTCHPNDIAQEHRREKSKKEYRHERAEHIRSKREWDGYVRRRRVPSCSDMPLFSTLKRRASLDVDARRGCVCVWRYASSGWVEVEAEKEAMKDENERKHEKENNAEWPYKQ